MNDDLAKALRRQFDHARDSRTVDRAGWTAKQWADDATRLMGDIDGAITSLVNGHVSGLIRELARLRADNAELRSPGGPNSLAVRFRRCREAHEAQALEISAQRDRLAAQAKVVEAATALVTHRRGLNHWNGTIENDLINKLIDAVTAVEEGERT